MKESHKAFEIINPENRLAPTSDQLNNAKNAYEKLLPPLVYKVRKAVFKWRNDNYNGISETFNINTKNHVNTRL